MSGDSRAELLPAVAAEPEHESVAVNAQPKTVTSIGNQAAQSAVRPRAAAGNPPFDNNTSWHHGHPVARAGVESASVPLPHLDRIQAAFGDRDLRGIKTQIGGPAARANDELGSVGYAFGDRIGFSSAPDIGLAAHEAAHVIQQRNGTPRPDGIDRPGDEYERRADGAAHAVTRGESATRWLPGARTHVGGDAPSVSIQRQRRRPIREVDPQSRLSQNIERLRKEALPAFQRGLDAIDRVVVEEAGSLVLAIWAAVEGAHGALRPTDGPDLPEFVAIRGEVLAALTMQKLRGESVAGPPRAIEYIGEVGQYIAIHIRAAVETVKDASALVQLLGKPRVEYEDEEAAVRLFAKHPNPWQLGYLLAVVRAAGLEAKLDTFGFDTHDDLLAILASQAFTLKREFVSPADRIGLLEPVGGATKVRVLRPYGARELALELYGDYSFYESLLLPYNRGVLGRTRPEGLVPAGAELLIEPRLVSGRYRLGFMAVEQTKRQVDRPYIEATPVGAATVGSISRYTVRWPVPPAPEGAWVTSTGVVLWTPLTTQWQGALLEWSVENDPATVQDKGVPAEDTLDTEAAGMETLTKEGASIEHPWPHLGTHTIRCKVNFGLRIAPTEIVLRFPQAVVTAQEKIEAEWLVVADPRLHPEEFLAQRPETYGDFQRAVEELGVTEDELAENPNLAAKIKTSYYPEFFLRDLRKQAAATSNERVRKKLGWQIDAIEKAIERTKSFGMRPLTALYVSDDKEHPFSTPLMLYLAPDPDAPRAYPYPLRLWDFTLEGQAREYTNGHGTTTASASLHGLLKSFANEAPYPDGTVRFALNSLLLPQDFAGPLPIARETLELHTDGGLLIERLAGQIITGLVVVVGLLTLQPQIVLVAFAIYGAVTGLLDIATRLSEGTFEWDLQTGLDILGIAGGLTVVATPLISAVRGFGSVAWLGNAARVTNMLQIGVMVGVHLKQIVAAHQSGDGDKIAEAWISAALDGALVVAMHRAGKPPSEKAPGQPAPERVLEGGRPRLLLESGKAAEGRASTAVGIGGEKPPGPPPGQEPPTAPRKGTPRAVHEEWAGGVAERGLSPRAGPGEAAGPEVGRGTYKTVAGESKFDTPEAAFAAYDEALSRAGGREVGIYRNRNSPTGEYVVRVGDEHSVRAPDEGNWESVLHKHPNPENVLTRRMPSPQDVGNTRWDVFQSGRPITEFIDYPLPDGRRALVAYTVEPVRGRVTIEYERADGTRVKRVFESVEAYASHYGERTTYVDPKSPEFEWMMRDLDEFYALRDPDLPSTAVGVLKPGVAPVEPTTPPVEGVIEGRGARRPATTAPVVRTRAQLDKSTQALEQQIETLKSHPDAAKMADELDLIKRQLGEGRDADASMRITALEQRVARAQLTKASGAFERTYGESEQIVGARVIEYVPSGEGPPVRLDATTPRALDATGQTLLGHVRRAIAEFNATGLTAKELAALKSVERTQRSALYDAFRGSHIDRLTKKAVFDDPTLEHVYVTVNFEKGADFYDSRTGHWYDITTTRAWRQHVRDYGPTEPGRTTIPGFRLPTEPEPGGAAPAPAPAPEPGGGGPPRTPAPAAPGIFLAPEVFGSATQTHSTGGPLTSLVTGFDATESSIIYEARGIISASEFSELRAAQAAGKSAHVTIAGRLIQYEPGLPASGMTMFGENGFLIGREAFFSEIELGKTILHELYRLETSSSASGVSGGLAASETTAAFNFAERAIKVLF